MFLMIFFLSSYLQYNNDQLNINFLIVNLVTCIIITILIIGSDQVATYDGKIVGKPGDRATAVKQLLAASGQTVRLYTGVALLNSNSGVIRSRVIPYEVVFRDLTLTMIQRYLEREQPYGCCGSLQADGLGVAFLTRISGDDPSALIGLPLITVIDLLAQESYFVL